jgi:hypothetical protein
MDMSLLAMVSLLVAWLAVALAVGLLVGGAVRLRDRVSGPVPVAPPHKADLRLIG